MPENFQSDHFKFTDNKYIINDITKVDETIIDFDYPIEIENTSKNNFVSTKFSKLLLDYLRSHHPNKSFDIIYEFMNSYMKDYDIDYYYDSHNWMEYLESVEFYEKIKLFTMQYNPRSLIQMGKEASKYQSMGRALDTLSLFVPMKELYRVTPEYNKYITNVQYIQTKYNKNNTAIYISKYAENIKRENIIIDEDYWALGIIAGLPNKRGLPYSDCKVQYTLFKIEELLAKEYSFLGVNDYNIKETLVNGFNRKHFYIEGVEHAHEIILLKELLSTEKKRINSKKIKFEHKAYSPIPHEFEEFNYDELQKMLNNKEAARAMLVTRPYIKNGELVLDIGEIYNAPYSRFIFKYPDRNIFTNTISALFNWRNKILLNKKAIDEELQKARSESMRANKEAQTAKANEQIALLEKKESERKSNIFKVYTRESLVKEVDTGKNPTEYSPKELNKAVLFNDIRDFTTLSESMSTLDVVKFLNAYFDRVNDVIMNNNGEIDKLIGDCIMAGFDNPDEAVKAAIEGRLKLYDYNRERISNNLQKVCTGIGVTYGPVIVGNIGSTSKLDYTLIGDVVNAASRLESLTKYYGVGIIISEDVKNQLHNGYAMRFLDLVLVKGKKEPVKIYEVYEQKPHHIKEMRQTIQPNLDEAFELYTRGNFKGAHTIYTELIDKVGPHTYDESVCSDPILLFYKQRCEIISKQIKSGLIDKDEWCGVYEFTDK